MLSRFLKTYWVLIILFYAGLVLLGTLVLPGRSLYEWVQALIPPGRIQDMLVYPLQHHHPVTFAKLLRCADITLNVMLFFPVGMGILGGLHRYFPESKKIPCVITSCTGLLLSMCIELFQARLPHRIPSVSDVVANTSGTILGCYYAYFRLFRQERRMQQSLFPPENTNHSKLSKGV
ncbi:hypothetical protein U27_05416 [Candidatus Vecturithrix granuli]|uniref:VanZ-like domain-containing protein n=1 Tax=Vecturithrix granuli TaxID=1499967 RepID=A0A081C1I7_VECG1|nr:hypothetical protein U27_05416 [Candidatus Vecturithrix granuli]